MVDMGYYFIQLPNTYDIVIKLGWLQNESVYEGKWQLKIY